MVGRRAGVGGGGESTEEHLVQICTHSGSVMFFLVIFLLSLLVKVAKVIGYVHHLTP